MIDILLSSHNPNKIREFRMMFREEAPRLRDIRVLSLSDVGILGEADETGMTFLENARIKAEFGVKSGYITVSDDSGLAVDALNGAPGVYSARYAGEGHNDEENNALLIENLQNIPENERTARYVCAISCIFPDGRSFSLEESCEGIIHLSPKGTGGFGYDPYFYFPSFGKTFAELTPEEKNSVSHRGKAFRRFIREFSTIWETYYADK